MKSSVEGLGKHPAYLTFVEEPFSLSQPQYIHGIYTLPLEDQRRVSFFSLPLNPARPEERPRRKWGRRKRASIWKDFGGEERRGESRRSSVVSLVKWKLKGRHSLPFYGGAVIVPPDFFRPRRIKPAIVLPPRRNVAASLPITFHRDYVHSTSIIAWKGRLCNDWTRLAGRRSFLKGWLVKGFHDFFVFRFFFFSRKKIGETMKKCDCTLMCLHTFLEKKILKIGKLVFL